MYFWLTQVEEIEFMTEFLIVLSWSEDRLLKDTKKTNILVITTTNEILESFEKYDYWFIRYKSIVQEGFKKSQDTTIRFDDDEKDKQGGGKQGKGKFF